MTYYTMQVHYGGTAKVMTEEFKDLCPGEKPLLPWIIEIRERIYRTGFQIQTSPTSWEFINPMRIHTVYLMQQDKKYAI